ncbi:ABC transporter substrate-binding protein [Streptomyces sp. NPDC007983]|uniref:ABC transporter substrate-binding protein n=1 Tax=Streptomyces sp. NPDC007983 TaxID=3364800 RepID=UPI0036E319F7
MTSAADTHHMARAPRTGRVLRTGHARRAVRPQTALLTAVRRRAAALAAVLMTGVTSVSGCAGSPAAPPPGTAGGGELVFATGRQPDCLDPQVSPTDIAGLIDRNIFDSLVLMTPDRQFKPWLAHRWRISPDGLTYTFWLRDGVTFHDGSRLDAAAVKATLDHAVDPGTKSQYAAGLISAYREAQVVNDLTVRVRLKHPSTPFLQALSTPYLGIQSPKAIGENAGNLCVRPVGSGPFRMVSWTKNTSVVLRRNDAYRWAAPGLGHRGPVRLDSLVIRFITEEAARFGALTSGQADVIDEVPPVQAKNLRRYDELRYQRVRSPGAVYALQLNSRSGPLADLRVRRALLASIDLDRLVKAVYFGQYERAWSPLSPVSFGYDPSVSRSWPHDPERAARFLDAAGWHDRDSEGYRVRDGRRLRLIWPFAAQYQASANTLAQGIQAEAKKAGIEIDYVGQDTGAFGETIAHRRLDLYGTSFVRAEPDILRFFYASDQTHEQGGGNVFGVADPHLDRALNGAARSSDPRARERAYAAAQQILVDRALVLPVYVPAQLVGSADQVRGMTFDAVGFPLFYGVRLKEVRR